MRTLNSLRIKYYTGDGITKSANRVIKSMNDRYGDNPNPSGANHPLNLGIGHSMGGLMLRDADRIKSNDTLTIRQFN